MGVISAVFLILITILFPPVGVFIVAGCGADFWINVCLTILGYFPGHIHAFYIEFVYYDRKRQAKDGRLTSRAPFIYSDRVQSGGHHNYGTLNQPPAYT